ncbi:hypothetical protein EJ03DRAFT_145318 [Teratosphaeria nubilosa]|uniref:Uncharacterized protein n=1 Tax=Teratosphaeria nubilosa TaxID=161662 RepID=A0A6G1L4E8_9PEZI|nr:hypothetical protein EJ03DRAFT_145318 [Teratosphaeria nubilosa]
MCKSKRALKGTQVPIVTPSTHLESIPDLSSHTASLGSVSCIIETNLINQPTGRLTDTITGNAYEMNALFSRPPAQCNAFNHSHAPYSVLFSRNASTGTRPVSIKRLLPMCPSICCTCAPDSMLAIYNSNDGIVQTSQFRAHAASSIAFSFVHVS